MKFISADRSDVSLLFPRLMLNTFAATKCPTPPSKPSLTCLAVVPLHIDAEDRDPLPLYVIVIEIDVWDGDIPGGEVPGGARRGRCLHGGVVLQHHHGFLHLERSEGSHRGG